MKGFYDLYHTDHATLLPLSHKLRQHTPQHSKAAVLELPKSCETIYHQNVFCSSDYDYQWLMQALRNEDDMMSSWGLIPHKKTFKVAFFDMDGTITEKESMVDLAQRYLSSDLYQEVDAITRKAMDGQLDFASYMKRKMQSFEGLKKDAIGEVAASLRLNKGIRDLTSHLSAALMPSFLVTAGLQSMAIPVVMELQMMGLLANKAKWQPHPDHHNTYMFTGELQEPLVDATAKATYVIEKCKHFNYSLHEAIVVGDGANDERMAHVAGLAVGYNPKCSLVQHLQVVNRCAHHMFLWDLLVASQSIAA
ncbi:MAG: HAD-IB family phosphatase [Proteobacteria bacterium]|nr:HAD-IB family phosphatase [Pseudomonadota bacterium]